jgi:hypothetical protein
VVFNHYERERKPPRGATGGPSEDDYISDGSPVPPNYIDDESLVLKRKEIERLKEELSSYLDSLEESGENFNSNFKDFSPVRGP